MGVTAVPRVYLDDPNLRPQTRAHHLARYEFAATYARPQQLCLDLMCGSGYGSEILRRVTGNVVGVDSDADAIVHAKIHYPACVFLNLNARGLGATSWFSLITWFEGIEHLERAQGYDVLRRCARALRDDGVFLVSTPRDLNAKYNRWHLSAWPLDELRWATSDWFGSVEEFGQDWDTAEISRENVAENDFYILVCRK